MNDSSVRKLPVLYSFRRCPYAMRARLGLFYSGITVELREVDLKNMPAPLCSLVPENPTVPLLQLASGQVLDESWDILLWAVGENDPDSWLGPDGSLGGAAERWIEMNDYSFKNDLDHYKYADRHPEHPMEHYRAQACEFIRDIEDQLRDTPYLLGDHLCVADIGVLPFIRQFALVDRDWFDKAPYPRVRAWLDRFLNSTLFNAIMDKQPAWKAGDKALIWGR